MDDNRPPVEVEIVEEKKPELVEQPKPLFNLNDLEQRLGIIYTALLMKDHSGEYAPDLTTARSTVHELVATIVKCKTDMQSIDIAGKTYEQPVLDQLKQEKPKFIACGVQLWQDGKLVGTSLYTTVVKAKQIRDICNKEYARLGVKHEAKIVNYPVF